MTAQSIHIVTQQDSVLDSALEMHSWKEQSMSIKMARVDVEMGGAGLEAMTQQGSQHGSQRQIPPHGHEVQDLGRSSAVAAGM
jgi:hypothetical protein